MLLVKSFVHTGTPVFNGLIGFHRDLVFLLILILVFVSRILAERSIGVNISVFLALRFSIRTIHLGILILYTGYCILTRNVAFCMEPDQMREIPDLNLPPPEAERAPNAYIEALREDRTICSTFRNALIKKEQLIEQMGLLLQGQGVPEEAVRAGVGLHPTELMEEGPGYRNQRLAYMVRELTRRGRGSSVFRNLLNDIAP